jgi:predicted CXXCH cytochrome family protein
MKISFLTNAMQKIGRGSIPVLLAVGVLGSMPAFAGISNTKHNLSSTAGPASRVNNSSVTEICVFCHTPHGSDKTIAPLWNKAAGTATYSTYADLGTSSFDSVSLTTGSISLACLACHDGTQAMNVMINTPGSGGWVPGSGTIYGSMIGTNQTANKLSGAGNIALIGTDLQNDHPISIPYAAGPLSSAGVPAVASSGAYTYGSALFRDADFKGVAAKKINGKDVWWVDSEPSPNGTREKSDMQLFARTGASGNQPYVECASCHDPHTETQQTFLRTSNTGSAICLACHNK